MEHMFYSNLMEPSFVCRLLVNGLKIIKQRASLVPNGNKIGLGRGCRRRVGASSVICMYPIGNDHDSLIKWCRFGRECRRGVRSSNRGGELDSQTGSWVDGGWWFGCINHWNEGKGKIYTVSSNWHIPEDVQVRRGSLSCSNATKRCHLDSTLNPNPIGCSNLSIWSKTPWRCT